MGSRTRCPLCGSSSFELIERMRYADIRYVYRHVYDVAIASEDVQMLDFCRCADCDLRFFTPLICGDSAFYERLQQFPWYYLADKAEYRIAGRLAVPNSSVLEIGCGSGLFSDFLPAGCSYRGLEFNDEAIRKARARGLRVDSATIEELAHVESARFDMVCSFQVLEHVGSPGTFLAAAARLLKQDGLLVIAVPSEDSLMRYEVNSVFNMPPHHVTRWTDLALKNVSRVTGLDLVRLEHEALSEVNIPGFAKAQVLQVLRQKLSIRLPMVSPFAASWLVRAILYVLSRPVVWHFRGNGNTRPGHSVVAAYRKRPVVRETADA